MIRWVALVVLLLATPVLAAPVVLEVAGQAPIAGGDLVRARDRALEDGLRQAVEQAASALLDPAQLAARASALKLRILPRARRYIGTYRVLEEGALPGGSFQIRLSAEVASDRLHRDLLAAAPVVAQSQPSSPPRAVVCATGRAPEGVDVGAIGDRILRELMGARSIDAIGIAGACVEETAVGAAKTAGAQGALLALIETESTGAIRGSDRVGARAAATVRLLDPDGRVVGSGKGERHGYAGRLEQAAEEAVKATLADALQGLGPALLGRWGGPVSGSGAGVTARVTALQRWGALVALERTLASLPGVKRVEPRRFVRGSAELWIDSELRASQLGEALSRRLAGAGAGGGRALVRVSDERTLEVELVTDAEGG